MATPHHFRDPCIHCGVAMADFEVGPCKGDVSKAVPIAYAVIENRWDGVQHYRVRYTDGSVKDLWRHASEHAPYFHFGASDELIQPPRTDLKLRNIPT